MMQGKRRGVKSSHAAKGRDQHGDEDERGLIERLKTGDHAAFERLFERYANTVYRQALRLLDQQSEAEEVVQEVFLTVYEKAHSFRGQSAFATWLHRITVNAALTRRRQRKRSEELSLEDSLPRLRDDGDYPGKPAIDWSNAPEERLASEEIQQLIQDAIVQLPPMDKAVVRLSDLEDLSDREIGTALGLSVGAVKSRLHRARMFLREKVAMPLGYSPI
jgi:RNA polymerase sigma-70 factor (ECF subfamily)